MLQMCRGYLLNDGAKRWLRQPVRHLMAENAHALRNRSVIIDPLALARDDENQALAGTVCLQHDADPFRMRLCQGHTAQVDAPVGRELPAREVAVGAPVHAYRL